MPAHAADNYYLEQIRDLFTGGSVTITNAQLVAAIALVTGTVPNNKTLYDIVQLLSGTLSVVGNITAPTPVEFTRENNATPYGANDVISSSAGTPVCLEIPNFFRVAGGTAYLVSASVVFNVKSVTPRLRLHLFNESPASANIAGDNLQHKELYADAGKRLRYVDLPAMTTAGDTTNSNMSRTFDTTLRVPVKAKAGSTSLWVLIETLDIVTLTALSKVTVALMGDNN